MPPTISPDEREALRLGEALRPLLGLQGWKIYQEILAKHIEVKTGEALRPCRSQDAVLASEADKGAIMGLRLAASIVGSIIADADEIRRKYRSVDLDITGGDD